MASLRDHEFMTWIAEEVDLSDAEVAPSRLRAKTYSALMARIEESGSLLSLDKSVAGGRELCVFEELVNIAPVGDTIKSLNYCRICHARVLAERIENAPIFWRGCPYVQLKNS